MRNTNGGQSALPTDISAQLREYASDPGYSHNDYADVMRLAADECERFYGGMMAWKQTAETKDRKLSEEMTARVNERVAVRLAELPPAQPDTAALHPEFAATLAAMGDDLDYEIGLAESIDRLRTRVLQAEAQLAAQAGQEPSAWTWDTAMSDTKYLMAHFGFDKPETDKRIINLTPLFKLPLLPANSLAIVQALQEAIDVRVKLWQNGCDCRAEHTCNPMSDIYVKKWQSILDSLEGK